MKDKNKEKKMKKSYSPKLIASLVCVIILILIIFIVSKVNDKSRYFKEMISTVSTTSNNFLSKLDLNNFFKDNNTYNLSLSGNDENDKINLQLQNNSNLFNANIKYKDYDLNYFGIDNKYYLESDTLLDNIYKIDENDLLGKIVSNTLALIKETTYDNELSTLTKELEHVLNKSIDKKYITKKKTTTLINNKEEKVTRYSYALNKESLSKLINNINKSKSLKSVVISSLNNYYGAKKVTEENLRDYLNDMIINGTLNIYVNQNKIKKVSAYLLNDAEIDFYSTNDYMLLTLKSDKNHNLFSFNYNLKTSSLSVSIIKNTRKALEFTVDLKENFKIEYSLFNNDTKNTGLISNTFDNESKTSGVFKISYNNIDMNISYAKVNEDIKNYDISNTSTEAEPTDEEKEKLAKAYAEIKNASFITSLNDFINELKKIDLDA